MFVLTQLNSPFIIPLQLNCAGPKIVPPLGFVITMQTSTHWGGGVELGVGVIVGVWVGVGPINEHIVEAVKSETPSSSPSGHL